VAWGLVASMACGSVNPAPIAPAPADRGGPPGKDPRRPDAVVVDPPQSVPSAVAHVEARGVITLREPAGNAAVDGLLQAFVDGWEHESIDALVALLAPDAVLLDGSERSHATLVETWRQRLRAHDYARLSGAEVLRADRVQRWAWDELGTPESPARPPGMRPSDLLVRAPLEVTRVAGERVFGDVMIMVLRHEDGKLRIAAYGEVDAP
jgi:hypothetical protein